MAAYSYVYNTQASGVLGAIPTADYLAELRGVPWRPSRFERLVRHMPERPTSLLADKPFDALSGITLFHYIILKSIKSPACRCATCYTPETDTVRTFLLLSEFMRSNMIAAVDAADDRTNRRWMHMLMDLMIWEPRPVSDNEGDQLSEAEVDSDLERGTTPGDSGYEDLLDTPAAVFAEDNENSPDQKWEDHGDTTGAYKTRLRKK